MLKEDVLKSFEGLKGKVSIVLKDLKNKDLIYELNSERVVPSASTIKILIMIEALNQILLGKHHLDEIICTKQNDRVEYSIISELDGYCYTFKDLITLMIIISDNTATNVLIDLLGFDSINNMALKLGLKETRLRRKMMDFEAAKLGRQNTTTTMDMAILMELLYNSSILDEDMCRLAIDILKKQKYKDLLIRYISEEVVVAHKSGDLPNINHDIGIFYLPNIDYLLGVFVTNAETNNVAKDIIGRISQTVYNHFSNI